MRRSLPRLRLAPVVVQTVTQLSNGSVSQSGSPVTVTNAAFNGTIATGGSAGFGFNGSWVSSSPAPAAR